jgi:hypothetical protein
MKDIHVSKKREEILCLPQDDTDELFLADTSRGPIHYWCLLSPRAHISIHFDIEWVVARSLHSL